jgi:ubiquinone/menaquinone biosynthesis C-methylase UbiE
MPRHPYPWWSHYTFENRLRRLIHRPEELLAPYVRPGQRVLEIGCGLGFCTLPLAELVGREGRVTATDVVPELLDKLAQSAERAGLAGRIRAVLCPAERLKLPHEHDFALAFWSMHETDDPARAARRIRSALRDGGGFLVIEPAWHVRRRVFRGITDAVRSAGFTERPSPHIAISQTAFFRR